MKKFSMFLVTITCVVFVASSCRQKSTVELPPQNVMVVQVIQQDIPVNEEFVGQTYGLFDISIQARVDGFLEGIHFEEGRRVKKGQLLYTIDPQPLEAKMAAAMGQLAEAKTMQVKAESDLARIEPLAKLNAVSQSDLVASLARIELGYTRIYSPINGIIGKIQAYPGDYVGRGVKNVILNEVSRIDTILVDFHISEEKYLEIARPYLEGEKIVKVQHREDRSDLSLMLSDGTLFSEKGYIKFINRQVDASTGTLLLQASFPNPNGILRPGQFAKVLAVVDRYLFDGNQGGERNV